MYDLRITGYTISLSQEDAYLGVEAFLYFAGSAVNHRIESLNRTEVPHPLYWFTAAWVRQPRHP